MKMFKVPCTACKQGEGLEWCFMVMVVMTVYLGVVSSDSCGHVCVLGGLFLLTFGSA